MTGPIVPLPIRVIRIMGWVLRAREEARVAELQGQHQTAKRKRFAADLDEGTARDVVAYERELTARVWGTGATVVFAVVASVSGSDDGGVKQKQEQVHHNVSDTRGQT